MFRHIVLFRVRDDVAGPELSAAVDALRSLDVGSGATDWHIALSTDERKGRIIVEDATFPSRDAFEAFRATEEHRAVAERLALLADWWIGDYEA